LRQTPTGSEVATAWSSVLVPLRNTTGNWAARYLLPEKPEAAIYREVAEKSRLLLMEGEMALKGQIAGHR